MSSAAVLSRSGGHSHSRHHLAIIDTYSINGAICVHYFVKPVPQELVSIFALYESDAVLAVDEHRNRYRGVLAYRRAKSGDRVVGALRIFADSLAEDSEIHVLFSPFAQTPGLAEARCQLRLTTRGGIPHTDEVHFMRNGVPSARESGVGGGGEGRGQALVLPRISDDEQPITGA